MPNENTGDRLHISDPNKKIVVPGSKTLATSEDIFTGRIMIRKANEVDLPNDWNDIPAIHKTRGVTVNSSEDLVFFIELPLYHACRMLFDAGIVTTESNCHFEPGEEAANVILGIRWDSLNQMQQNGAEKLCREEPDKWQHISAEEHGDKYEALYLNWKIKKSEVNPRQVKLYVEDKVKKIIQGRIVIK